MDPEHEGKGRPMIITRTFGCHDSRKKISRTGWAGVALAIEHSRNPEHWWATVEMNVDEFAAQMRTFGRNLAVAGALCASFDLGMAACAELDRGLCPWVPNVNGFDVHP